MNDYLTQIKDVEIQILKPQIVKEPIVLSVVIPTYKRGDLLEDAIDSIIANSNRYPNVEIIVLSNDPDDDLHVLCEKYKVANFIVLRNSRNLGMCGNINKCLFVAKGEYVAYLHDDDFLMMSYLPQMLSTIKKHPDADAIIPARYLLMGDNEWGHGMQKKQLIKHIISSVLFIKKIKQRTPYCITVEDIYKTGRNCFSAPTCGTTFRRKAVIDAGGFSPDWKYAFDFIFYEEFCRSHKVLLIKEPLGMYRMVESASNEDNVQLEFFKAQKYALDKNKEVPKIRRQYYEYLHLFYKGLSSGAQKLINQEFGNEMKKWKKAKYYLLRLKTEWFYFSSGIETERYLSKRKREKLFGGRQ